MAKRMRLIVKGRVQGVFYRENTMNSARKLGGLTGYVKNLSDGSVEVVAEGEEKKLRELLKICKKGSFQSDVQSIEEFYSEPTGEFEGFLMEF
jgi:acylphosphatase